MCRGQWPTSLPIRPFISQNWLICLSFLSEWVNIFQNIGSNWSGAPEVLGHSPVCTKSGLSFVDEGEKEDSFQQPPECGKNNLMFINAHSVVKCCSKLRKKTGYNILTILATLNAGERQVVVISMLNTIIDTNKASQESLILCLTSLNLFPH